MKELALHVLWINRVDYVVFLLIRKKKKCISVTVTLNQGFFQILEACNELLILSYCAP